MNYNVLRIVTTVLLLSFGFCLMAYFFLDSHAALSSRAAIRNGAIANMKRVVSAMLSYEQAKGHYPAQANFERSGKPLLSWRVHILPYLGREAGLLHSQFRLDEPWDSEHNLALIPRMPPVYRSPVSKSSPGRTNFTVPIGSGTLFENIEWKRKGDIKDGAENTVLLVEVDDLFAPIWTKPEDWTFDPQRPLHGLMRYHPDVVIIAFCDGRVVPFEVTKADELKPAFSHSGSEKFNLNQLLR